MLRRTKRISDRTSRKAFFFFFKLELLYLEKYQTWVNPCLSATKSPSFLRSPHLVSFFITEVYHFIHTARRKTTTIYKRGPKKIITMEYKEDILMIISDLHT